jgi:undecaprenyl-diphosphatase
MKWEEIQSLDMRYSDRLRFIEHGGLLRMLAIFMAHSADPWTSLIALFFLFLVGDAYWKLRALVMIVGTFLTAGVIFVIKYTVRRRRPQGEWGMIYRVTNPHSFPSGHAARCFMLAVVGFALGPVWFGLLLLIWGILVSVARVGMGVHYLSDIIVGSVIGLLMGWVTIVLYGNYEWIGVIFAPYLPLHL